MARKTLIQARRDTAANWTSVNPVLASGEPGWESDTRKIKIGDGSTAWNSLSYETFGITGGSSGGGGSYQLDYVPATSDLSVTATSSGTAQTVIAGNSVTYDGSTRVRIEFWTPLIANGTNGVVVVELYRDSTLLGRIAQADGTNTGGSVSISQYGAAYDTPSAGSHTYTVKAWRVTANGTVYGTSLGLPAFLRVSTDVSTVDGGSP